MGWDAFWKWASESPLGATIVGGLIVAAIVGLVALVVSAIPKLRAPVWSAIRNVWSAIRNVWNFIVSIRLTTTTQIEAATESARQEGHEAGRDAWLKAIDAFSGSPTQTLKDILLPTLPEPHHVTPAILAVPPQKMLTIGDIIDQDVRRARSPYVGDPPAPPEPVSWSARRRAGGDFVLANLSTTDTAYHVAVSAIGFNIEKWDSSPPSWDEVGPKQTVYFDATRDPTFPLEPRLTVVWEDAGALAHEAYPQVRGL